MTTVRQPTKRQRSCVLTLKYTFICVYWWTRQRIHNTLIVVDRYLRLMGDKTIPDSAEPRLESFYPPFVAGIDLPHQGVVDSYNLTHFRFQEIKNGISYCGVLLPDLASRKGNQQDKVQWNAVITRSNIIKRAECKSVIESIKTHHTTP